MPEDAQGLEAAGLLRQRIHWLESRSWNSSMTSALQKS